MSSKIKNIIILVGVVLVLIFVYFYFFGKSGNQEPALVTTGGTTTGTNTNTNTTPVSANPTPPVGGDFLSILLNLNNIKLDTSIFSDKAFISLHDSTIELLPDNNQGRPNPFAPIGSDIIVNPVNNVNMPSSNTINTGTSATIPSQQNPTNNSNSDTKSGNASNN